MKNRGIIIVTLALLLGSRAFGQSTNVTESRVGPTFKASTDSVGLTIDLPPGQSSDLLRLRVDGTSAFTVSSAGVITTGQIDAAHVTGWSGVISGLTANTIPKATSSTHIANSLLTDDGTALSYTGTGGITSTHDITSSTKVSAPAVAATTLANTNIVYVGDTAGTLVTNTNFRVDAMPILQLRAGNNIGQIKVAPSNPSIIYAVSTGVGLIKSMDGGASWADASVGVTQITGITNVEIDNTDANNIYIAHLFNISHSTDGGGTWATVAPGGVVNWVALSQDSLSNLLIATSSGIMKSTDSGATWVASNTGITGDTLNVFIDPADDSMAYVGTNANYVYKTTDGGATWVASSTGLLYTFVSTLVVSPSNHLVLYVAGSYGVYKSTDAGATWLDTAFSHSERFFSLVVSPTDSNTVYGAAYAPFSSTGGIYKTTDGGAVWTKVVPRASSALMQAVDLNWTDSTLYWGTDTKLFGTGTPTLSAPQFAGAVRYSGSKGSVFTDGVTTTLPPTIATSSKTQLSASSSYDGTTLGTYASALALYQKLNGAANSYVGGSFNYVTSDPSDASTGNVIVGDFTYVDIWGTGNAGNVIGGQFGAWLDGTKSATMMIGVLAMTTNYSANAATRVVGLSAQSGTGGAGGSTDDFTVYINTPTNSAGTMGTHVGLQIDDQAFGSAFYAIRTIGAAPSLFGGPITAPTLTLSTTAAPSCDSAHRFEFQTTAGGTGVKDVVQVCAKDGTDAYAWRAIY